MLILTILQTTKIIRKSLKPLEALHLSGADSHPYSSAQFAIVSFVAKYVGNSLTGPKTGRKIVPVLRAVVQFSLGFCLPYTE